MSGYDTPPAFRSSFVTALAWFFIVLAAFSAFVGILQNVLMQEMFLPSMYQPMQIAHHIDPDLHTLTTASFALAVWFFRSFMLMCLVTLAAAIGLLLRKEWARKVFIGLLSLAIFYQLIALVFHWWVVDWSLPPLTTRISPVSHGLHMMYGLIIVMKISATLMTIGFGVLSGWIISRLCSPIVRLEFVHE